MKKNVLLVLAVIILFIFAFGDISVSAATSGDLTYNVTDGKATITYCNTSIWGELEIPKTIDGYPVTAIGFKAFNGCTDLTSVNIPEGVTSIGSSAFLGCTSLISVSIPASVTSIKYNSFYNCINLTSVTLPDGITFIGYDAFYNTGYYNNEENWENDVLYIGKYLINAKNTISGIYEVKEGTLVVGDSAFEDCAGLTSVKLPEGVTSIGNYAFRDCSGLNSITIPDSLTTIGDAAFEICTNLKSVYISDITNWCKIHFHSIAANPLFYADNLYLNGEIVETLKIPNGITEIGDYAFSGYDGLTRVIFPNGVKKIGEAAFYSCDKLENINIPDSVESVGLSAFSECTSLKSVILPDSITNISNAAFDRCSALTSVVLPDGITQIPNYAFNECTSLTEIIIPEGVEIIGSNAFKGCLSLRNITIPHTAKTIYRNAFDKCSNLIAVSYRGTVDEWNSVVIGTGNSYLINSNIFYIPRIDISVSNLGSTFTVNLINIVNGKTVILALYDEEFVEMQSAAYNGEAIPFTTTKNYTKVKVMVWDNITNLKPVCNVEIIE